MQKRILSLLLVGCMLLSLVPMMAISAFAEETEAVNPAVSTNFSFDAENPNFPTFDLPLATEATTPAQVLLGKYDYSGLNVGAKYGGLVTYNGNWSIGSLAVNYDKATDTLTFGTAFAPFLTLSRDTTNELALTDNKGTWGSTSAPSGGGLWLAGNLSVVTAPMNYTGGSPNNERVFVDYYATSSIRYTAPYTGVVSIDVSTAFRCNNGVDLVILHNGVEVGRVENDGTAVTSKENENTDFGTVVVELAVSQFDTIDFVSAGDPKYSYDKVGEAFDYQQTKRGYRNFDFTINYAEGWTFIDYDALYEISTWNQADSNLMSVVDRDSLVNIQKFFTWYHPDGTPVKHEGQGGDKLAGEDYAVVNPALYEAGVINDDMTWEEKWDAYGNYLKTRGIITYNGDWTIGNIVNGEYKIINARAFASNYGVYACRWWQSGNAPIPTYAWEQQFATSSDVTYTYIDAYVTAGKNALQPDADGKLYFRDVEPLYQNADTKAPTYSWAAGHGGLNYQSGTYAIRPGNDAPVALTYTVPAEIYGTAHIDLNDYLGLPVANEKDAFFAIAQNGEVIWPAEAIMDDKFSWYQMTAETSATALTAELESFLFDVKAGDEIQFLFHRGNTGEKKAITIDIKPTIMIEKKYAVEFSDCNGDIIYTAIVSPNAAMPTPPIASAEGYYVNGAFDKVDTLPEKVEGNTFIQYAGDFDITPVAVDKVSISVGTDFAVNLYLKGDPYATKVGLATDTLPDTWGVKQADGTFKVTIPSIAAKDLSQDIYVFLLQEFNGGYDGSNMDMYILNPVEVMQTYLTDEEYADVRDIASAAIDYAAAADAYFNGADLSADVAARLAEQDAAIAALSTEAEKDGFEDYTIARATVVLKGKVALKIGVEMSELSVMEDEVLDFSLRVVIDGEEKIYENGFAFQEGSDFTAMVIVLDGMVPADFDKEVEITLLDGFDEISDTLTYSVNTYIARTFEGGAGETDNLLRALYALGVAANA